MDFLVGITLGIILSGVYRILYNVHNTHNTLIKPLDMFIDMDISELEFIERRNTLVKLKYSNNCDLVIMIDKGSVNIFVDDVLIVYSVDENEKRMEHLFNKLMNGFYDEVYLNVTEIGGNIYSNNLIVELPEEVGDEYKEVESYKPSVDDILDKINRTGLSSLTKLELNILNGFY